MMGGGYQKKGDLPQPGATEGHYEIQPDTWRSEADIDRSNRCIDNAPRSRNSQHRCQYQSSRRDHGVEAAHLESLRGTEATLEVVTDRN